MGYNLITGCHKCKTKVFHFRGEENIMILPFYKKHAQCIREDKNNVQTNVDQIQEESWMDDYEDDSLQV